MSIRRARPRVGFVLLGTLIALALVVPIVLFGLYVQSTINTQIAARNRAERVALARTAAATVAQRLGSLGSQLGMLASEPSLVAALRQRDDRTLQGRLDSVFDISVYDRIGIVDASAALRAGAPAARRVTDRLVRSVAVDVPLATDWVLLPSDPNEAESLATAGVLVVPIREGGTRVGNLYAVLSSSPFSRVLDQVSVVGGRLFVVIDSNGIVVAGSFGEGAGGDLSFGGWTTGAPFSTPDLARALRETGEVTAPSGGLGKERLFTYAPSVAGKWAIYLIDAPEVVLAGERQLSSELLTAATLALIAAAALSITLTILFGLVRRQRAAVVRLNAELASASEQKTRFLSNMSHELRTPLNAINGFSQVLLERMSGELNAKQEEYLRDILDAGRHLLGLVNELLDLAKVEAGKLELQPQDLEVRMALQEAHALIAPLAAQKRLAFELDAGGDLGVIHQDPKRLRQVLNNLLSNAVKFTPEGGRVHTAAALQDGGVEIRVTDTGPGIGPEDLPSLFREFEQVGAGRGQGTGLGLALSKRLVDAMGGGIHVTSEIGKGTTFMVRLPRRQPAHVESA